MKAKLVRKLAAFSLSLAMLATMVPVNAQTTGVLPGNAAILRETASKESETQKIPETGASAEKESVKTYKTKLILPGVKTKTKIKSLNVKQDGKEYKYTYSDLETTSSGELTLKLPANAKGKTTTVVVNDVTFSGTVTDDDKAELKVFTPVRTTEPASEKSTEKTEVKSTEKTTEKTETEKTETEKTETEKTGKGIAADKLVIDPIVFEAVTYGYASRPAAKPLKITNSDSVNTTQITDVTISGNEFELHKPEGVLPVSLTNTEPGKIFDKLTIQPKQSLKAGTYKTTVTVVYTGLDASGKEENKTKTADITFTVEKKTLEVLFGIKDGVSTFPYNGSADVSVSAAVTGALGTDKVDLAETAKVLRGTMTDSKAGVDKPVNLSKQELEKLVLNGADAANYQLGALNPKLAVTVTPAKVTPDVASVKRSKVYDKSKEIEGTLTATGILDSDKDKVKLTGVFELAKADAGIYTKVTVKDIKLEGEKSDISNYELTGNSDLTLTETSDGKKIEIEVEKAEAVKKPKEATISRFTYNSIEVKTAEDYEYALVKYSEMDDLDYEELEWESTASTYLTLKKDYDENSVKASTDYTVISRIAETKNYKASKKADYKEKKVTTLRNPVTADSSKNSISGITSNGTYKVSNSISFSATGASTGMSTASLDDVRYTPKSWNLSGIGTSGSWTASPYSASFTPTTSRTYTLEVLYRKEKYNGSSWIDQNSDYKKTVTFTVNSTGKSGSNDTYNTNKTTTGVKTGDVSPIITLVILLVVCVVVFGAVGVMGARKKKRNK